MSKLTNTGENFSQICVHGADYIAATISKGLQKIGTDIKFIGDLYVYAINDDAENKEKIIEKCTAHGVPRSFFGMLERVGRDRLLPELIFKRNVAHLCLSRCEISDQRKYIAGMFDVCTEKGETIKVSIDSMTNFQAQIVFNNGRVRTIPEQRAFIESMKVQGRVDAAMKKATNYTVKGGKLYVGDLVLTKADVLKIMVQMEG